MGPHALEITPEVYQVGGRGFTAANDAAIYLVTVDGIAALIDAGCGHATDLLLANIESAGTSTESVRQLFLTHCHFDHTGGAAELRKRLGCMVIAYAADAGVIESGDPGVSAASWYGDHLMPCPVDRKLDKPREILQVGARPIEAIHIPGHSPGSVAYLFESAGKRILFAQDVHGPLHPDLRSNAQDYQASLRRLLDINADVVCEGHYGVFTGKAEVSDFIERFIT
jgi:glyoxylase-like metal-dependent hydrolase (beta-lactamase superfamily II)